MRKVGTFERMIALFMGKGAANQAVIYMITLPLRYAHT